MTEYSAGRMADHFTEYLFQKYEGDARHVQRVASWLGLLALGLDKVRDKWKPINVRQLVFEISNKRYKGRYNHQIKPKGGIEFVEVAKSPGSPDVRVIATIASLADAEAFYKKPPF